MSQWNHDVVPCPPDSEWVDKEPRTARNFAAELASSLPNTWTVEKYVMMDPQKQQHGGGAMLEEVEVTHTQGATISAEAYSTHPQRPGGAIYNAHQVKISHIPEGEDNNVVEAGPHLDLRDVHEVVQGKAKRYSEMREWFTSTCEDAS